ncbi:MAG TPA: hypothetical protein DCF63_11515 [Planctomycetaceae bacterium]|nr:hypothetical protein [Planctomycetaceae bacterium]
MLPRLKPQEPGKRLCLRCGSSFHSKSAGNRICRKCTQINATIRISEAQLALERGAKRLNGHRLDLPNSYETEFC